MPIVSNSPAKNGSIAVLPRREYTALNAMRGVAAIAVMLFHGVALVGPIFPRGYLAVDLFFVLSGFVIGHAYEQRLATTLSISSFALLRLVRFWPLYLAGLGFGLLREVLLIATHNTYGMSGTTLLLATAAGALFIPVPLHQRDGTLFPLNIPSWSLFFELLVNGLYAFARPALNAKTLVFVITVSTAVLLWVAPLDDYGSVGVTSASFVGGSARTILSFSMGLLIYRLRPDLPEVPTLALLIILGVALAFPWGGRFYDLLFVLLFSPLLVTLGISAEPIGLLAKLSAWLGVVSFPLYAIHRPLLQIVEAISTRFALSPALLGAVSMAGLVMLATIANHVDVLARRRLTSLLHAPSRRNSDDVAAP